MKLLLERPTSGAGKASQPKRVPINSGRDPFVSALRGNQAFQGGDCFHAASTKLTAEPEEAHRDLAKIVAVRTIPRKLWLGSR
jgi:hypothetical protein